MLQFIRTEYTLMANPNGFSKQLDILKFKVNYLACMWTCLELVTRSRLKYDRIQLLPLTKNRDLE